MKKWKSRPKALIFHKKQPLVKNPCQRKELKYLISRTQLQTAPALPPLRVYLQVLLCPPKVSLQTSAPSPPCPPRVYPQARTAGLLCQLRACLQTQKSSLFHQYASSNTVSAAALVTPILRASYLNPLNPLEWFPPRLVLKKSLKRIQ